MFFFFFFKQKTAYEIGLGIPAEPLFRSQATAGFFDLVIGKILTSRLSLSKHLAHNLGNLLLLGKIGVFHNRRNASSRLKTKLSLLPKKLFRIRMSRNFGMKMLTMTNLSTECLIQLTKLGYDATPFNQILKQNAKREMRLRLGKVTVADVLAAQPVTTNLLKFMRASIKMIGVSNLQSFIASMTQ